MSELKRLSIIKLAAFGDVTMAVGAFLETQIFSPQLKVQWVVDQSYASLISSVLNFFKVPTTVDLKKVNTKKLFQGHFLSKILFALRLFLNHFVFSPDVVLLLHRDKRYLFIFKVLKIFKPKVKIISIEGVKESEANLYLKAFLQAKKILNLQTKESLGRLEWRLEKIVQPIPRSLSVLIGGGRNTKGDWPEKRWPYWVELIDELSLSFNQITLLGGKEDQSQALEVEKKIHCKVNNLVGRLEWSELLEHLSKTLVFISVDSGLAHLAALMMRLPEQRVITLFGPTDLQQWSARAWEFGSGEATPQITSISRFESCSPCYKNDGVFLPCRFNGTKEEKKCLRDLSPKTVIEKMIQ